MLLSPLPVSLATIVNPPGPSPYSYHSVLHYTFLLIFQGFTYTGLGYANG
jgi:hypothetical protein